VERTRSEIVRLAHRGLDVTDFSLAVGRCLRSVVPFDGLCVMTLDPATVLPTGHVIENGLPEPATRRLLEIELQEPDVNKFTELARRPRSAASLSEATDGALEQSVRHRELRRPHGLGDELRAALSSASSVWGGLVLMREAESSYFTPAETALLASLCGDLAEGLRRAMLFTALAGEEQDIGLGVVLLADDNSLESANGAAEAWLDELRIASDEVPSVIQAVANRARHITSTDDGAQPAAARVRARSGRWLLVRGSMVGEGPTARVAVILESAGSPELAPLIAEAYGLTERERTVTRLVAQGLATNEIASRMHLSPYTVQDHLKSIFEKADVSTRGELVARVFFEHYAPRMS
jgi:DNA-binding CsgD family transcriptional regulator